MTTPDLTDGRTPGRPPHEPLLRAVESCEVDLALVDRALERVLRQECELGLLDADWDPTPPVLRAGGPVELDPASSRAVTREVAERAVVLLSNDGTLPLALRRPRSRSACPVRRTRRKASRQDQPSPQEERA